MIEFPSFQTFPFTTLGQITLNDPFKIDSHKLNYHIGRVNDWLENRDVYPIYVEISPAGACNHRCSFCAVDYIGYQVRQLPTKVLKTRLTEMGQLGVKSVMFAGEGEPLLHKDLLEIIRHTKQSGIDVSITTNAVPLTNDWADKSIPFISWIRASINAGTPDTYAKVHQTKASDFELALSNLKYAVEVRNLQKSKCAVGAQMVLLPENENEALLLAQAVKSIGCDYLIIKPYSQHKFSHTRVYEGIDYSNTPDSWDKLKTLNGDGFSVVIREHAIEKLSEDVPYYNRCQAIFYFWAYIMADGSVYGCSAYLLDEKFCYGNINQSSFQEIWTGPKRKTNIQFVENELNITDCRKNCRMDEVNRFLWDVKHPPHHVNFI